MALTICLNLNNLAPTQYMDFDFESAGLLNDKVIVGNVTGIAEHSGNYDGGYDIDSIVRLMSTDFGSPLQKFLRWIYVTGQFQGNLRFTFLADEDYKGYVNCPATGTLDYMTYKIPGNNADYGRYLSVQMENVDGTDFSIDGIETILMRRKMLRSVSVVGRSVTMPLPKLAMV